MKYFYKLDFSNASNMGKKEIKKLIQSIKAQYDIDIENAQYRISKFKERKTIICREGKGEFFLVEKFYLPSLNFIRENNMKYNIVYLNEGALKQILRGADVMAAGILIFYDESYDFKRGDICLISIKNEIIAVGIALIDKSSINNHTKNAAIEIYHYQNDELDLYRTE